MAEGVDASYDPPTADELVKAGKQFIIRYVSTPGHAKNLTAAERVALQAAGLDIAMVCQVTKDDALAGFVRGQERARSGRQQVIDLGGPADGVLYFVVDFDATADQLPTCHDYIRGAASVLGHNRTGVYGGYRTIRYMADRVVCRYYFQTYAWSGGVWDSRAQLQQYRNGVVLGSGLVDLDRSTAADFGQWNRPQGELTMDDEARAAFKTLNDKLDLMWRGDVAGGPFDPHDPTSIEGLQAGVRAARQGIAALAAVLDPAKFAAALLDAIRSQGIALPAEVDEQALAVAFLAQLGLQRSEPG